MQPKQRTLGAFAVALLATACGSQVPPKQVVGLGAPAYAGAANPSAVGGVPTSSTGPVAASTGPVLGSSASSLPGGVGTSAAAGRVSPTSGPGGASPPLVGIRAGSCAGFKNTTGITDSTITIANVADLSGPVPGLFKSALSAVTAYAAYFNSTSSICGRKLKVESLDSGTSESGDQQGAQTACGNAFAMVGSLSAFDAGGAAAVNHCGIPDLRTLATETARDKSPVSYGVYSTVVPEVTSVPFAWVKSHFGDAYKNAAFVYLNAGAAVIQAQSFMTALRRLGYDIKDQIAIDVTSVPNYGGYVTQLKSDGIKYVEYIGAYQYAQRLKETMYQQGYNPVFMMDPVAYDAGYVAAGTPVNGTYSFVPGPLFEEAGRNPQLSTYIDWLQRTSGGPPTFFGVYAWAAAALFTQLAVQLGGRLTRAALLAAVRNVHNYTNGGMTPPQDVGGKHTTRCASVVRLVNGRWVRQTPYPYTCANTINTGVGA